MMWKFFGTQRPSFAKQPGDGQESVWDYPRPPKCVADLREVVVLVGNREIARTVQAVRVLETASPPTFYIPSVDVDLSVLKIMQSSSFCEWKGQATYWSLESTDSQIRNIGWSYQQPSKPFALITDYMSFYPAIVECYVAGERVRPQPGGFYGGWVTNEIVGPYKGEPGTSGW